MRTVEVFFLLFLTSVESLEEGDDCNLPTGQKGSCVNIHDCAYARQLLENKQYPETCGFEKNNPLVCCIEVEFRTSSEPGVLSAAKCKEYYPYKKYFILIGAAKPSLAKEFPHMTHSPLLRNKTKYGIFGTYPVFYFNSSIGFGDRNDIQWSCGGSLISHTFILTAAHCLGSSEFGAAKFVRLGDLDIASDTDEAAPQDFDVKRTFAHPGYKRPARYHDIGLIELDRKVKLTEFVAIACLDTQREHNETQMTVTGWGRTEFLGSPSSHLLKANFNVVPNSVCRSAYQKTSPSLLPSGIVDDAQICAGGTKDQDTCQGDSGGPLQVINGERSSSIIVFDIVGVTSFGKACGLSATPGVYTRVYNYLSWIESIVWPFS